MVPRPTFPTSDRQLFSREKTNQSHRAQPPKTTTNDNANFIFDDDENRLGEKEAARATSIDTKKYVKIASICHNCFTYHLTPCVYIHVLKSFQATKMWIIEWIQWRKQATQTPILQNRRNAAAGDIHAPKQRVDQSRLLFNKCISLCLAGNLYLLSKEAIFTTMFCKQASNHGYIISFQQLVMSSCLCVLMNSFGDPTRQTSLCPSSCHHPAQCFIEGEKMHPQNLNQINFSVFYDNPGHLIKMMLFKLTMIFTISNSHPPQDPEPLLMWQ